MRHSRKPLVLLTASYPYGTVSETFLDDELPMLARSFSPVIVVPSSSADLARPLPPGVELSRALTPSDPSGEPAPSDVRLLAHLYFWTLAAERHPLPYIRYARTYFKLALRNLWKLGRLLRLVDERNLADAVFYDYWLENSTLALAWLRRSHKVRRAVARAHRFDLYDECWPTGAVPFRAFKVASLDRVLAVSQHGLARLQKACPRYRDRLVLSRLGVRQLPAGARRPRDTGGREGHVVISCSSLQPHKRVERIPAVLALTGLRIHWTHFGDGPGRSLLEAEMAHLPPRVSVDLRGHVDHGRLLDHLRNERNDLFLSLSASEGLPVSMMEAISAGIPIVAPAVYGIPEIVTTKTGTLVSADASPLEIAEAIRWHLGGNGPSYETIVGFSAERFSAEDNYTSFAKVLDAL